MIHKHLAIITLFLMIASIITAGLAVFAAPTVPILASWVATLSGVVLSAVFALATATTLFLKWHLHKRIR